MQGVVLDRNPVPVGEVRAPYWLLYEHMLRDKNLVPFQFDGLPSNPNLAKLNDDGSQEIEEPSGLPTTGEILPTFYHPKRVPSGGGRRGGEDDYAQLRDAIFDRGERTHHFDVRRADSGATNNRNAAWLSEAINSIIDSGKAPPAEAMSKARKPSLLNYSQMLRGA